MSAAESKAIAPIAREYFEASADENLARMDDRIAPDYVRPDPGLPFRVRGPEGVKRLAPAFHPASPDLRIDIEDVAADGKVAEQWAAIDNLGMTRQLGIVAEPDQLQDQAAAAKYRTEQDRTATIRAGRRRRVRCS